jgi:putative glutamine amidotransferase
MPIRIAIPEPTSSDQAYNQRSLPLYLAALRAAGATPIIVPLHERQDRVARLLAGVQGILLPGSGADVDPQRYGEDPIPECGEADPGRTAVDELLLQDAFNLRKPILGICHGTQTLNVWRNGSLVQDLNTPVNHRPGREVVEAHPVRIAQGSRLARLLPPDEPVEAQVNSSHHQAIRLPGDNLLVSAVSPVDGVIEAVELDSADHFVLAVQWHPERTYTHRAFSRAIFAAFVRAAEAWEPPRIDESVSPA